MDYFSTLKIHMNEMGGSIFTLANLKFPIAVVAGILNYMIGGQNVQIFGYLLMLMSFDFVSAIMAKHRIGEPIESRKALKTVTKLVVYSMLVAATHLTEQAVPGNFFLEDMAIAFLAITEFISITENFAKMGYTMPQKLINRLRKVQNGE